MAALPFVVFSRSCQAFRRRLEAGFRGRPFPPAGSIPLSFRRIIGVNVAIMRL
jgi:hypothetical protein